MILELKTQIETYVGFWRIYLYIYIYMSNRKTPGNTKYVFDGHWFMEIDGNC